MAGCGHPHQARQVRHDEFHHHPCVRADCAGGQVRFTRSQWDAEVGAAYAPPMFDKLTTIFGTDIFGRSVLYKVIHGTRIAMSVGLVTSLIAIPIGVSLGAIAGYFGGIVDEVIVWFYTTISSIPSIMLLVAFTYVLGKGIFSIYIALGVTSRIGLARLVRGEFMKHKNREYVIAAESIGTGHLTQVFSSIFCRT